MTITELRGLATHYEEALRNFRLSGNIEDLAPFIYAVLQEHKADNCNYEEFFDSLTVNEVHAYESILEEIGADGAGNISIVKMIQRTNLSRPVFTSLLQKMEKYHIAIVKNQGVKGTHIVFANSKN